MSAWLPRPPAPDAAARVFCIPQAGYGSSVYSAWPQRHGGVELLPVELPARGARFAEPMPATHEELARDLATALLPHLDRPFALFGHCWSAHAAYQVAVELAARGGPDPAHIVVSSQVAPQDGPYGRMLDTSDADLAAELEATIRAQGHTPFPELVALYVRVLRADVEVARRYRVAEPTRLACPVTALGWRADEEVAPELMRGWSRCGSVAFSVLDGPHLRFVEAPDELLELVCAPLAGAVPALRDSGAPAARS